MNLQYRLNQFTPYYVAPWTKPDERDDAWQGRAMVLLGTSLLPRRVAPAGRGTTCSTTPSANWDRRDKEKSLHRSTLAETAHPAR